MMRVIGVIIKNTTFPGERLDLINRKRSCPPTGTRPSPSSVSVWKSDNIFSSLSSTSRLTLCTHWSLMSITVPPHWVVARGRSWLVRRPLYSTTATRKGSMSFVIRRKILEQELVSLATMRTIVTRVTQGLDLAQEGSTTTLTRVVTKPCTPQIMEINILKPWDTSWYNEKEIFHIILIIYCIDKMTISRIVRLPSWIWTCQYITGVLPWINLHWAISAHLEKIWDSFV